MPGEQHDGINAVHDDVSYLCPPYSPIIASPDHEIACIHMDSENEVSLNSPSGPIYSFKLIGGNIRKDVKPRHMHIDRQAKSLHYFSMHMRFKIELTHHNSQKSMTLLLSYILVIFYPQQKIIAC